MEAASPPLTFPVSAVQATGPPLRPQGSLPRSLRDGSYGPPLTPEPLRPLTAQRQGQGQSPCPPDRTALTTKPNKTKSLRFQGIASGEPPVMGVERRDRVICHCVR